MTPGPQVQQPDATPLQTTGTGQIPLSSKLSPQAQQGLILPHLKSASLIAMGPLCDDDCNVIFSKKHMAVIKNNEVILRGKRNKYDDLWDIPIEKNNHHAIQHWSNTSSSRVVYSIMQQNSG